MEKEQTELIKQKMPSKLIQLAKIFKKNGAKLYVVGGFVRDCLLGLEESSIDFDLASNLSVNEIEKMLNGTIFKSKLVNKKLGTLHIYYKDDIYFEHTTFRKENYIAGNHAPASIKFVTDLKTDASRRDFSINSIYYDVLADEVIDLYNGKDDLESKIIKCIETPEYVFRGDGLRLLRMLRFFCQLPKFTIEEKTYQIAKQQANLLNDISQERIAKEIISSLNCFNKKTNDYKTFVNFVEKLIDLGFINTIFKKTDLNFSKVNLTNYKNIKNSLNFKNVKVDFIFIFLIILLKLMDIETSEIEKSCQNILTSKGLQIERKKALEYSTIISGYFEFLELEYQNIDKCVEFVQKFGSFIEDIYTLVGFFTKNRNEEEQSNARYELEGAILYMKLNDIPFTKKDLPINGWDIKRIFPNIEKSRIKEMLDWAFQYATKHLMNDKVQIIFALERKESDNNDDIKSLFNID